MTCLLLGNMALIVLRRDGAQEISHVEDDKNGESRLVDIDDREEYFVKPLYTYYCNCGQVSFAQQYFIPLPFFYF
ncbi:hypothetical protein ANCCAN_07971 [Ancylostoma caninum]|uniref:Uncharacterized protein n=1 Tax=Ancylostoma caninum TaxID=29170 RepID=A0A368GNX3_ANCCA|nr:hypothetical protein ANCCAN_07971 [Ancylostoma caninum]